MPLQTVEPQRLYRQIAEQLRALIGSGEYQTGARLPAERDIAKELGVSRPSVREALIALEVEGWVEIRTGSGEFSGQMASEQPACAEQEDLHGFAASFMISLATSSTVTASRHR